MIFLGEIVTILLDKNKCIVRQKWFIQRYLLIFLASAIIRSHRILAERRIHTRQINLGLDIKMADLYAVIIT